MAIEHDAHSNSHKLSSTMNHRCITFALPFLFIAFATSLHAQFSTAYTFPGDNYGDLFGRSVSGAGDVNGDGFDDVIAGAPGDDNNGPSSGSARVLSGFDGNILFTFNGDDFLDEFGSSVSGAGDVNGDGFDDVIVGAFHDSNNGPDSGNARIFSGFDGSILYSFDGDNATDRLGSTVSGAGDVNGDGFDDVIVGISGDDNNGSSSGSARVFSGIDGSILYTFNGDSFGDQLGYSVSGAGDVNGDGFDDVIAGAIGEDNNGTDSGIARVFSGFDGSVLYTFDGDNTGDVMGRSVSGAGDVNDDGFDDVVAGAAWDDNNGANSGSARVFSGFDGSILYTLNGDSANDEFGYSVGGAGDVNGDGFDDVIAGAPFDDNNGTDSGSVRIFSGFDGSILYTFNGNNTKDEFGRSVSGAGDVNGDGLDEVIAGAPGPFSVALSYGSARIMKFLPTYQFNGDNGGDAFGTSVAAIGDINGDFVPDFVVGAPLSTGGSDLGTIRVISGSTGDTLHAASGPQIGGKFGTAVCGIGDITGDGIPNFAVGAPRAGNVDLSNPPTFSDFRGAVNIYSTANGLSLHQTIFGEQPYSAFGSVLANAGDVNGDGVNDLIVGAHSADFAGSNSGRVNVYSGANFSLIYSYDGVGAGDRFGFAADGVGDVNHDGFDDFAVGAWFNDTNGNNAGAVYVYSGATGSLLHTLFGNSTGNPLGGGFGYSVAGPGDVNGDGTPDILVGSPYTDDNGTDSGSARVFSGVDGSLIHLFTGVSAGDNLGYSVGNVGDLNGDGYDDILVGAPFEDDNGTDSGVVRVFSGLDGVRIQRIKGLMPNDNLGKSVAGIGDINLDGFADLLLGAPGSSTNGPGSGAVSVVISPTLPTGVYDFGQSGLALKLVWVPDNGDANSPTGAIVVLNATPGGTGINVASLAPALFPTAFGFPLLVANDPGNVLETGSFGFNGLGVLVALGISRQNPVLAGTTVFIQIFEIAPLIQGSNGLKFLLE
ncbi:MAG: hypothetical protein ACI97A_000884 [Planctomycetota bacterium]|jgi:hypothetical protein